MPCPYHHQYDHSNDIWHEKQVIKPLLTEFSPFLSHLFPLRSKHSPQHPVLKHPQSVVFSKSARLSFIPMKITGRITVFLIYILLQTMFHYINEITKLI
jgi:hypothetical protein